MPHKKEKVHATNAPAPPSFLSQGVVVGDMVYVSGAIGVDPKTNQLVEGTIQDRTTQCLKNISSILNAAGTSIENAVKVNVFITDMSNYDLMNQAYSEVFNQGVVPVRTCVAVKQLPRLTDVEIEASAHL
ncbi:unnamed protein product [Clonostachys solani]|uniref:Uncharacterized protein n=1 Tax=Clonostachys solani TaxID=160281 RepID=A0A9N9ZMC1_9HYPO|nr:unnamed protein product [Clonostachys solani]